MVKGEGPVEPTMIGNCSVGSKTGRWILAATLLASGASFIMWSATAVALPSIQGYFDTNIAGIQWVVNSHLLALSAFLLIGGSLGDHFGRKKVFLFGMLLFAIGAILSGFAWSIGALIGFQALQGFGSALMVPQSLAIINACFAERERGRAIGIWAGISGGIAALGPWVGGWLVESFGWPAVFWMTLPVIALSLIVTARLVPENLDPKAGRLDWLGTLFILLGLSGLPLIPLKIFKNPLVSGANSVTLLLYFAFNGVVIFSVLNLQQIQGFSPIEVGVGLLPPIVIITFLAAPAGALADRFGPRPQMIGGPLLVALGIALLTLGGTSASYFKHFLPGLAIIGIGMGLVIAPLTKSALSVETRFSGSASGVNNAIARTAGLLAVAVVGAIMVSTFVPYLNNAVYSSTLTIEEQSQIVSQADRLGGITVPESFDESARMVAENAVRDSFIFSFRWAMGACAALAFAGSIISFLTIRPKSMPDREKE
jgi:MFS family permease